MSNALFQRAFFKRASRLAALHSITSFALLYKSLTWIFDIDFVFLQHKKLSSRSISRAHHRLRVRFLFSSFVTLFLRDKLRAHMGNIGIGALDDGEYNGVSPTLRWQE